MLRDYWPVIRTNAIAAALFGAIMALMIPFLNQAPQSYQLPLLLAVTVGYVLMMNRWLPRVAPPPPVARARKGSFKKPKGAGWQIARWSLAVVGVGMAVQIVVFLAVYTLIGGLLEAVAG